MNSSKTYTILQSFNKYEINRIRKFLQSPYFNSNEAIISLFEAIIKNVLSTKEKELVKEIVWESIYKEKKYDDVRFRKLNSELLKLVEQFLAQQIYEENPIRKAVHLMEAVGNKKLDKLYSSTLRTARRLSDQQNHRPANFYFYQYEIERQYYDLIQLDRKRTEKGNEGETALNLDCFYLAEKLRIYCYSIARKNFASHEYDILFIDEIVSSIEKYGYDKFPPIAIYYQIYLISAEPDDEDHYYKLIELLDKHSHLFIHEEALSMYRFATNYCIGKVNRGQQKFLREYFDLSKIILDKELLFMEGILPASSFNNITLMALRLEEFDWADGFIKKYSNKLPITHQENTVTFNKVQLLFFKKEYDKVISLLHQVEYDDIAYNLLSKSYLLMTYYETDEIEPLYSFFESFRAYLNRNKKIPQVRKRRFLNLIKFTKKLCRMIPGDKKTLQKIEDDVKATKEITSKKWLLGKIAELK